MMSLLRALWSYRHFLLSSIVNDLRTRFARSKLGALWMLLQPLAMVAMYALVLSQVLGARLAGLDSPYAYAIYLLAGIVCWQLFLEIVTRCLTVFVDNGNLLKKIMFPRVCLPVIAAGSALVNNILLVLAAMGVFALLGHTAFGAVAWLVPLILLTAALACGLGLLLGTINVFVRDVAQVMQVVLQLLFWMTPIVYMPSILPAGMAELMRFNPLATLVAAYHAVLVYGKAPDVASLVPVVLLTLVLLGASLFVFRRASAEMVDVL